MDRGATRKGGALAFSRVRFGYSVVYTRPRRVGPAPEVIVISQTRSLVWPLLMLLPVVAGVAQDKTTPSRPHPAPQIAGRFIDSDGRSLLLHTYNEGRAKPFTGLIQSACMVPAGAKGESKPLNLKAIPLGTAITVFYFPRRVRKSSQNIILALRFDRVPTDSGFPQGVVIPCVKTKPPNSLKG